MRTILESLQSSKLGRCLLGRPDLSCLKLPGKAGTAPAGLSPDLCTIMGSKGTCYSWGISQRGRGAACWDPRLPLSLPLPLGVRILYCNSDWASELMVLQNSREILASIKFLREALREVLCRLPHCSVATAFVGLWNSTDDWLMVIILSNKTCNNKFTCSKKEKKNHLGILGRDWLKVYSEKCGERYHRQTLESVWFLYKNRDQLLLWILYYQ